MYHTTSEHHIKTQEKILDMSISNMTNLMDPRPPPQHTTQVMSLRKQVRTLEVELLHARVSGLAGVAFGSRGGEIPDGAGAGADAGNDASSKAVQTAENEAANLRRYVGDVIVGGRCHRCPSL